MKFLEASSRTSTQSLPKPSEGHVNSFEMSGSSNVPKLWVVPVRELNHHAVTFVPEIFPMVTENFRARRVGHLQDDVDGPELRTRTKLPLTTRTVKSLEYPKMKQRIGRIAFLPFEVVHVDSHPAQYLPPAYAATGTPRA